MRCAGIDLHRPRFVSAISLTVIAVVLAALAGCASSRFDPGDADADADMGTADAGSDIGAPSLQRRIDDAVASIQSHSCFAQDDTSQCEWADYQVGPAQFDMGRSTGEAVLVIDDFGAGLFPGAEGWEEAVAGGGRDSLIRAHPASVGAARRGVVDVIADDGSRGSRPAHAR
jgi:hypothetical protein